jgi:hypothetical protein
MGAKGGNLEMALSLGMGLKRWSFGDLGVGTEWEREEDE